MEESVTDKISDRGSIPLSSKNTTVPSGDVVFFKRGEGNRTRREPAKQAEGEGPVDLRRRRGLKGGKAAGGIPLSSKKYRGTVRCHGIFI